MAVSHVSTRSISIQNTSTPYSYWPVGLQVGDVMVAHLYTHYYSSIMAAGDWNHMFPSATNNRLRSYWKYATPQDVIYASESANSLFILGFLGASTDWSIVLSAYRGAHPSNPIKPGAQNNAGPDGSYSNIFVPAHITDNNGAMSCATLACYAVNFSISISPTGSYIERVEANQRGSSATSLQHWTALEHGSQIISSAGTVPSGNAPISGGDATNWYATTYSIEPDLGAGGPGSQSISVPKVAQSRIVIPPTVFLGTTAPIGEGEPDPVAEAEELENETLWAEFETRLTGPPEPIITTVGQNPDQGTIFITWERTDVSDLSFVAYEVAVSNTKSGEKRVARITNPNITEFIYPYPLSGLQHTIKVRQEVLEGADLIQSRWAGDDIAVEYDKWFIRDIDDPLNNYIGFDVLSGDNPQIDRQTNKTAFRPQGRKLPVHYLGQERSRKGSVTVRVGFHEDDRIERLDRLYEVADGRRVCILGLRPSHKIFACLEDPTETLGDRPWISGFDVPWEETEFEEDVILREGR